MLKFLNLNPEIFGMDVSDLSLKVVKLKKKRSGFALVSFNEIPIKPGVIKGGVIQDQEALIDMIKLGYNTVKGKKLGTKYVIVSLPEEKSFLQMIQMPKMTEEELKSAVPFEAENYIPLTIDKVYLDFQVVDSYENTSDHLHLLINVMPKSIIDSYVFCFKKAGLIPCILEFESQAITRALLKNGVSALPIIFIDFGQAKSIFIIFSRNSIQFTSSITISSEQLTHAISDKLDISFNKAEELKTKYGLTSKGSKNYDITKSVNPILNDLVSQIKKYIIFYNDYISREYALPEVKIAKIILCGGGANLKKLADFLYKGLDIPTEVGNPFINILPQKNKSAHIIPDQKILSYTTALGLALRGASDFNE